MTSSSASCEAMTRLVSATCTSSRPGPGMVHSLTTRDPGTATARCRCSPMSSRLSGARSSKLRPTRASTERPVRLASEALTCRMRPRMSSTATPCGASAMSRSVRACAASTSSRRRFSSVTSRSTIRARSGCWVMLSCSGTASTETSRAWPVLRSSASTTRPRTVSPSSARREGRSRSLQHPAVAAPARWHGEGVELAHRLGRGREPAARRVVVQQHLALVVHDDEGVGDGLGDDPQVLGLTPRPPPGRRGVGDQLVALPLHRRQHQAEQGREHHERLEREHLTGDVGDVGERGCRRWR